MDIVSTQTEQKKRIHPHKFTLWVAIGSIIMMFAGLTSAYIVKSNSPGWHPIILPKIFWYSTAVIVLSSITIQMAVRSLKEREMNRYRMLVAATLVLGITFIIMQFMGFYQLWQQGVQWKGAAGSGQFLYVIAGLHAVHVLGGAIALLVLFVKAFLSNTRVYTSVPTEVVATYWHFVDVLWIYLLIFFILMQ